MKTYISSPGSSPLQPKAGPLRAPAVSLAYARAIVALSTVLATAVCAQDNFRWVTNNNNTITILVYLGLGGDVVVPGTITDLPVVSIGSGAFSAMRDLTSITLPEGLTNIESFAFEVCEGLTTVAIPDSVISIGDYAFASCKGLTNASIGSSVTTVGSLAFHECYSLAAIAVDPRNSIYSSVDGVLFNKSQTALIKCPQARGGIYEIPNNVAAIGDWAFADCRRLSSVTIPNSVLTIGTNAFGTCISLTSLTIPNSVTRIEQSAFHSCLSLASVTIPNSVTHIGNWAFYGTGLTRITIPDSLTSIGGWTFNNCESLTNVTIPNTVTNIGDAAFGSCSGLSDFTIPGHVRNIANYLFSECTSLTKVTIPDSVLNIGSNAFSMCFSLTSLTVPNSVTNIGDGAFAGAGLTDFTIPDSVSRIGNQTFSCCMYLTNITIPDSVTSIGDGAFFYCISLTGAHFEGNAPTAGTDVFDNAPVTVYYLPGTTEWSDIYAGCPTAPWVLPYPVILTTAPNFGVQTNRLGFRISWATNASVLVEASTTLANPLWSPLSTNNLINGWTDFSDAEWTNYPSRFYRIRAL